MKSNIIDLPELREQTHVFQDRTHAGQVLVRMLAADDRQNGIILAIPAGGVAVGVVMAEKTGLDFDVASAYQHWSDVAEKNVVKLLERFKTRDL